MNKKTKILMLISILILVMVVTITTYAWFESTFDPVIYSDTMYITSSDGLVIQLTDDPDVSTSELNIKTVVRDGSSFFELPQVSSTDGETFYRRKRTTTSYEYYEAEENEDYIEVTFMLKEDPQLYNNKTTNSPTRYIYIESFDMYLIDKDGNRITTSTAQHDTVDAIRTSIKVQRINDDIPESEGANTYIIARDNRTSSTSTPQRFDGITDTTTGDNCGLISNFSSTGYDLSNCINGIGDADSSIEGTQHVKFASQFIYSESNLDFTTFSSVLYNSGLKIILRIWLEGSDPACDLDISGLKLYYNLKFGSYYYIHEFYDKNTTNNRVLKPIIINNYDYNQYNGNGVTFPTGTWYIGSSTTATTFKFQGSQNYYQTWE